MKLQVKNASVRNILALAIVATSSMMTTGCWVAAGAAGAEAGYVASQEDRTAGQTIDDQVLLASIKSKLVADKDVPALKINVDVFKGNVSLRGYVPTQAQINRAIEIAQNTKGVVSVDSKLILDPKS